GGRGIRPATARQGWKRNRPGPFPRSCARERARGQASLSRDAAAASANRGIPGPACRRRRGRSRQGRGRAPRQGRDRNDEKHPRVLNAEDDTTLEHTEIAVDLAMLDPATDIAVLRGGTLDHAKYRGRRVFGSGINLTHLYQGKIPYLWFLTRDLGFVHKLLR